ncbi:MAG: hypothetical protein HUJ25_17260 [Crocinitomicaceae bacterium]|nr:hypothetical protein [Crocinitomicaceae bacterium]
MDIKKKIRRKMWMIPVFMVAAATIIGFIVMGLWNWIMPSVFGLGLITFWQALGILILGRILFGGFKKHRHWGMRKRHAYAYCHVKHNRPENTNGGV